MGTRSFVPLKVYVCYGTAADQVTALRLQALGAVNGLSVYVPPAYTRQTPLASLEPQSEANLGASDIVLGVITAAISESCRQELNASKVLGKSTIVMAWPALARQLERHFPGKVVVVDPANPVAAEVHIVQVLKRTKIEQDAKKALIALGTLALGLLLFAPRD